MNRASFLMAALLVAGADADAGSVALAAATETTSSKPSASEAASAPASVRLTQKQTPDGYELSVPVSRLVLVIPSAGLVAAPIEPGGARNNPRYFSLRDPERGLMITGWFESSEGYPGLEAAWASDTEAWKRAGVPDPSGVSFETLGDWHAVRYDNTVPGGSNTHLRAHYVAAGTWIDVHMSLTSIKPVQDLRAELSRVLEGFRVTQKPPQ